MQKSTNSVCCIFRWAKFRSESEATRVKKIERQRCGLLWRKEICCTKIAHIANFVASFRTLFLRRFFCLLYSFAASHAIATLRIKKAVGAAMQNSGCRLFACNPDRLWLHPCFSDSFSLRKVRLKANPDAPYQQCLILDLAKGSTTKKKEWKK